MKRPLSARARLTLLYSSLFTLSGAVLVTATYLLVAHTLPRPASVTVPQSIQRTISRCITAVQHKGDPSAIRKCGELYVTGVRAGAATQRNTTLAHLLTYSVIGLAGCMLLAVVAGWLVAGRILRPVHRLTIAARSASEQDLSQRINLQGPRDELRELADTFDAMLERIDRSFTSQRQFIANASHELRTPLTVMRTAIDVLLAKQQPTRAELHSTGVEIRQAIDHAQRLIEALLLLARNDKKRPLHNPLDLATIVEDVLDGRAGSDITMTRSLEPALVNGDAMLLERLVSNLVDNAERYNIANGTICVITNTERGESLLRVVNSGPVVPPEQIDRLLLPFTRVEGRTRHDGFGLGLTLVSSIAAVHDGVVHVVAPPTGGLDITVRLPRRGTSEIAGRPTSPAYSR